MKYDIRYAQTGRSIIETMGYMIVSMFLIVGVAKIITGAYNEYKLSQASIQLSDLAKTIVNLAAADADYNETIQNINDNPSKYIPKSYRVVDGTIYNVLGGEVQISILNAEADPDAPSDKFSIIYTGVDREQCIALMTKEWTNNQVVDLDHISLNGNFWYWPADKGDKTLPVKIAEVAGTGEGGAEGLCVDSDIGNTIVWGFN